MFNSPLIKKTLLFIILAELLSLFGWFLPEFNMVAFFVILFVTLILSLHKLEYGIYILLAELFIASEGYLFSFEFGDTFISIRIGLFLIVMAVWLYRWIVGSTFPPSLKLRRTGLRGAKMLQRNNVAPGRTWSQHKWLILLFVVIAWGFIWGIVRGNDFGNVFLDFNNWLYFLLIFPVYWVYKAETRHCLVSTDANNDFVKNILSIFITCVFWVGIKSLILLYIFSHQFVWALPEVYKWVRDTRVGEVTLAGGGFYRVFLQSQIYSLLLFFIVLPISKIQDTISKKISNLKFQISKHLLLIVCLTTVILSFSRSYWVGFVVALLLYYFIILVRPKGLSYKKLLDIFKSFAKVLIVAIISFGIVLLVINLPPRVIDGDLVSLLGKRATELGGAGASRINQLKPLSLAIAKHPVIGSGFGTTLTYITNDPRIVPETAGGSGEFTTYAFEWGYLDMILKFGLVGLIIYLILIFKIEQGLFRRKQLGFALALIALLIVNIFSPYLNHPLGIGFIIISSLIATGSLDSSPFG